MQSELCLPLFRTELKKTKCITRSISADKIFEFTRYYSQTHTIDNNFIVWISTLLSYIRFFHFFQIFSSSSKYFWTTQLHSIASMNLLEIGPIIAWCVKLWNRFVFVCFIVTLHHVGILKHWNRAALRLKNAFYCLFTIEYVLNGQKWIFFWLKRQYSEYVC